jgi:hypothetical protein
VTNEAIERQFRKQPEAARMKVLRPLILLTNWALILTIPIWGGVVLAIALYLDRNSAEPQSYFRGKKWMLS